MYNVRAGSKESYYKIHRQVACKEFLKKIDWYDGIPTIYFERKGQTLSVFLRSTVAYIEFVPGVDNIRFDFCIKDKEIIDYLSTFTQEGASDNAVDYLND